MTEGTDMGENATAAAVLTQEGTEEQAERTHNSDEESDEEDPYVSTDRDSSNSGHVLQGLSEVVVILKIKFF
jgi:hypothetical protein